MHREIIKKELSTCLLLAGEPMPKNFDLIIDAYVEELKDIPASELSECFKVARREQKFGKFPKVSQIHTVQNTVKSSAFEKRWNELVRNTMEERLANPGFFPENMVEEAREYLGRRA